MSAYAPNYRIKHKEGWEVELYVDAYQLSIAQAGDKIASDTICRRFRVACDARYDAFKDRRKRFIVWGDLTFSPIPQTIPGWTGTCCDEDNCKPCNGEPAFKHESCEFGCTLRKT